MRTIPKAKKLRNIEKKKKRNERVPKKMEELEI